MKYIDIRFEFEELEEDDYKYIDLKAVSVAGTNLTEAERNSQAEILAQSDRYWVDTANAIINVIGGEEKVRL